MSNMVVLGEKNKEIVSAILNEGTVTSNTISSETGEVTGFIYTNQLFVGDFVTVHEDSTMDNLIVEKFDSDSDLPIFGMIINEPIISNSENGERKAGLLILGNIIRFKLDEEAEINVNDKIALSDSFCTSSDKGHYYALFSANGDEYNYLDVFLPFTTATNGSAPNLFVFPEAIRSSVEDLGDYYGLNFADCGDIGDYAVITDSTKDGFGKIYQVCNFASNNGEILPKEEANLVYFNAVTGISWSCPQNTLWVVEKLLDRIIYKYNFPDAKVNDLVLDFNTGNLHKISTAIGSAFYLTNLNKTINLPLPNFGVTNKSSTQYISTSDVTMNNSAQPKFGDYIIATGDNYILKVTEINWDDVSFTKIYQYA